MATETEWVEPFFFLQLADTQFGFTFNNKLVTPEEIAMAEEAVLHINNLRPKFAIICGDLANAFPEGDELPIQDDQFALHKQIFSKVDPGIPLICLCGNHDVGNTPTPATIERYKSFFGADYFVFWAGGVKCIVLNSSLMKDGSLCEEMVKAQQQWLDMELRKEENPQHIIFFSHIPPFVYDPFEPDDYFNFDAVTRQQILSSAATAGVSKWFCGHYHRNAGGWYHNLEVVITSAVGVQLETLDNPLGLPLRFAQPFIGRDVSGFRIVVVKENEIIHQWFTMCQVPTQVIPSNDVHSIFISKS